MRIILLSGGSGKRLWPLSSDARSKQFLKVLQNEDGNSESMVQRIHRQIKKSFPKAKVLITASEAQHDSIRRQLGGEVEKLIEPSRRNTYPAVLLSCAYLMDKEQLPEDEVLTVLPVDPYVEQEYFEKLKEMERALHASGAEICLLGMKPTYPSEKYGYIIGETCSGAGDGPDASGGFYKAGRCVEKPGLETARKLVQAGARWNGGVFMFRASFARRLIETAAAAVSGGEYENAGSSLFERLYNSYERLSLNSFDYEVIEKCTNMVCVPYDGEWNDLGTWNTLTEKMHEPDGGFVIRGEDCKNTHVINELEIPIVALGLKDMVVVASADGILVSDKHASSYLQPYVGQIHNRPMYEKRQWGEYQVLDFVRCRDGREASLTKRLHIEAGRGLSCQLHHLRDEIWTIVDGEGIFLLDDEIRTVRRGDILFIKKGQRHAMASKKGVTFIEVQNGTELVEEDIERFEWDWSKWLG